MTYEHLQYHKINRIKSGFKWVKPKKPLVLFLAKADWAGLSLRLCNAVNRYTDWDAVCVSNNRNVVNNGRILADDKHEFYIRKLMKKADVIIFGSSFCDWLPYGAPINPNAYLGVWHVGSAYRKFSKLFIDEIHPKLDFPFVGKGFEKTSKNLYILAALYDIPKTPIPDRPEKPVIIGHSPSGLGKTMELGQELKGSHHLLKAMKMLKKQFGDDIQIEFIQGVKNPECLERKKKCHIFFDQIGDVEAYERADKEIPMYGVSLLEAAANGTVCLSHANSDNSPLFTVNSAQDIYNVVSDLVKNPKKLKELGKRTKEWAIELHGYKNVAERFIKLIESKMLGDVSK